ncbi:nucleoside-diphosphate kinase [Catenovulum sp. 2E275]|uniref:nucleoside-diphosphate kinase n=1 Tax=Catenovulum sp. 2E275 TaxID=2980497 RepID=UPI0021CE15AE|nr:nucleoside-diphosphate kinase [Catenovulum sp. 2E275]MCU4676988.1 nucleoside-diphosphate kinase [Catenovulum sp. 2E275]
MAIERTLSIIKPNAVSAHKIGTIIERLESAGFTIVACKMVKLTEEQAEGFYAEHKEREFFPRLMSFMLSAPVVVLVLERDNAIEAYREIMGTTDPEKAATGTIRADHGENVTINAVHGSDSPQSAAREIAYFFAEQEVNSY